ncbi:hypothetical protein [Actinoplanes sp. NPDC051851]|uniref:hypothetical protein n=1 Tax=Actinoplanes sp. NPDC051851 TaxID=3154753 RepID=UPI00341BE76F
MIAATAALTRSHAPSSPTSAMPIGDDSKTAWNRASLSARARRWSGAPIGSIASASRP